MAIREYKIRNEDDIYYIRISTSWKILANFVLITILGIVLIDNKFLKVKKTITTNIW